MESDTPRTDALVAEGGMRDDADFARELERELAAMRKQRDEARELYCVEASYRSVFLRSVIDARTIARIRGWEGLFKEGGGA